MPSEGSFAASGPRRHGEPPARRPRGVGARWHQGHFDSCPVFWGHLPGAFWFLPGSCRPRLGSPPPPGGGGAGVLFTRVPLKPPKPGQERALPSQDPRPLQANGWAFLPQGLCVPWLVACLWRFVSHLPWGKSRMPAFHFSQEHLLPSRRQNGGTPAGCTWSPSGAGWGGHGLALLLGLRPFPPTFGFVAPLTARTFSGIIFLAWHPSGRWVCARGRLALVGWSGGLASASTGDP